LLDKKEQIILYIYTVYFDVLGFAIRKKEGIYVWFTKQGKLGKERRKINVSFPFIVGFQLSKRRPIALRLAVVQKAQVLALLSAI